MDRKGWIILILCGIGMMFTWKWKTDADREAAAYIDREQAKAKPEELTDGKSKASDSGESSEDKPKGFEVEKDVTPAKAEELLKLVSSPDDDGGVIEYTFSNKGGGVKLALLKKAEKSADGEVVLNRYGKSVIGALSMEAGEVSKAYYSLVKKTDNKVVYRHKYSNGAEITKVWTLAEGGPSAEYRLKLNVVVKNVDSAEAIQLKKFAVTSGITAPLFEDERADLCKWFYFSKNDYESGHSGPFTDGFMSGIGIGSKAKSIEMLEVENLEYFGVSNQFYSTIIQPTKSGSKLWVTSDKVKLEKGEGEELRVYTVGANLPNVDLEKGLSESFKFDIYAGPRKQSALKQIGANTDDAMSYGWFGWFAPQANWAINWIHDVVTVKVYKPWAWGIAIVILTILIRILIWPLTNKSTRTMKRMAKLQPMMKELREQHKDNPQRVQQETLKLYKKYKINPMGGCLPMLIQMPIFFAVFGMLTNAVELRGEDFLWLTDLSRQENLFTIPFINIPFNILPFTMAITMVFQMKMNPSSGDKLQRRIFMLMPILFFFFCYGYASALALYWTVQNLVSILQTWLVKRMPEPELVEAADEDPNKPRKKGFMEKMAEKLEEAQKQREAASGRPAPKPKAKNVNAPQDAKIVKDKKRSPKTGG